MAAILIFKCTEGWASGIIHVAVGGGGGGKKKIGTVITSLKLAFTKCIVPATQAFDWPLDNNNSGLEIKKKHEVTFCDRLRKVSRKA